MRAADDPDVTITIPNYHTVRILGEGHNAIVYQGYRRSDSERQCLTLKVFKDIYPSPGRQARFQRELRILQRLNSPYLVEDVGLEEQGGLFILTSRYYDDLYSLRKWLARNPFSVDIFLKIATHLARGLEDIHSQEVMHGDLKPSNILIDAHASVVKLTDFGISRIFEQQFAYYPASLEGTLPYISPEQTGRTGKPVDYRSDFYSLGVTLFQVAVGRLPFESEDRLSLIHAHLAIEAPRASDFNPALPQALSDIIFKLMAKNPEERYQTAAAIRADLERCQAEWQSDGIIKPFILDAAGRQLRFELPRKLYGREAELKRLAEILDGLGQGQPPLVLVKGSSGVGKSFLIWALQPSITAMRGMFVSGKYGQYQRNNPYSALARSLQTLLRHLLREPASALEEWREAFQTAVGVNGRVISEVIPEIELMLGPQPPLPTLPHERAQTRFSMIFAQFLRACAPARQPLILFLDDLQWADESSLEFLQTFLADPGAQPAHLLILGAYRDNEVGPNHSLQQLITRLTEAKRAPYQIHLTPLNLTSVKELLNDTLQISAVDGPAKESPKFEDEKFNALARLLHQKSDGNPFFLSALLRALYDDNLLRPPALHLQVQDGEAKAREAAWNWDLDAIQNARLSDDVLDLLIQKLDGLPKTTLGLLKQAACLGSSFQLVTLGLISELDLDSLYVHLKPAMRQGFIWEEEGDTIYFMHDRVQEAAYRLLDRAKRQEQHWQIGQTLLARYDRHTLDEQLFSVVNQLNQGRSLLSAARGRREEKELRTRLIELNYRAGLRARDSIAFGASLTYFQIGRDLLPEDAWERDYEQTYRLWYELFVANILLLNLETALSIADVVLARARSKLDQARCYRRLLLLHASQGGYAQAVVAGNRALALYKQALPDASDEQLIRQAIGGGLKYLAEELTGPEAILNLPDMTDPAALIQIEIRYEIVASLYRTSPQLFVLNSLQMIRLALEKGSHPALSIAFAGNSVALILQGQLKQAAFFRSIAASLWQRYPTAFETAQTVIAAIWSAPLLLPDLEAIRRQNQWGQTLCKNVSNIYYWGVGIDIQILTDILEGRNLTKSLANAEAAHSGFFRRHKVDHYQKFLVVMIESYLKPLLQPDGQTVDLEALVVSLLEKKFFFNAFHLRIFRGMVHYTFGDYAAALEQLTQADNYLFSNPAGFINSAWQAYYALALLAQAQKTHKTAASKYIERAEDLLARVETFFEYNNTFRPHAAFIRAELAYTRQEATWHSSFFAAIDQAAAAGYRLLQATIHERLAIHLLAAGYRAGRGHIEESLYLFEQCGAIAKVRQLQQTYSFYLRQASGGEMSSSSTSVDISSSVSESLSSSTLHQDLDTHAILKASQAISSEIDLKRVLSVIMKTIGEVSGAESACLVMEQGGKRMIQARYEAKTGQVVSGPDKIKPVLGSNLLSGNVARYVHRTGQTVLLDDAYQKGEFTDDPYIQANKIRSLLCHPIRERKRLVGVIYLENNLSSHAFTPERVEVVRLLAGQSAISITNAQAIIARAEQERVQRELAIALNVQRSMLPSQEPRHPHFNIAGMSKPAREVGGDWYGYYQRPNNELAAAVGDVTGKGIPAALLMGASVVALTGAIEADLPPGQTLTRTHRALRPYLAAGQNVAICLAYLDNEQICVANAGGIAPLIRNKDGVREVEVGGIPLGVELSELWPYNQQSIRMSPGELLVMSSDGVVEAVNSKGEMYGFERFEAVIASGPTGSAQAALDHLLSDWQAFVGGAKQHDDFTVVIIKKI